MYFFKPVSYQVRSIQRVFQTYSTPMKLILAALFACIAAVLQSAGGVLPGIGFVISPLATAPILLCAIFSIPLGVIAYFLTILLLIILQPAELIIFPFTTGLLGLGIGVAFSLFNKRISMIASGAIVLFLGICSLLYLFRFPILGPIASDSFSLLAAGGILIFSFLYSWLWVEIALIILKRIKVTIV